MPRSSKPQPRHAPAPSAHYTRRRVLVIAASVFAMLAAALLATLGMTKLPKTIGAAPLLPIGEVIFVGDMQRVDAAELKRVAGGIRGSMLRTDLNEVKAAVKQVHWVRNADVRRRFPATLEVRIEEHRPFAKWITEDADARALVNTFGEVFEANLDASLPLFRGPQGSSSQVLMSYISFKTQLAAIGQVPLAVTLSARRAWQLNLDNGVLLELGRSGAAERLARFVKAYPVVPAIQTANVRVDMRYQSGMAVKLADDQSGPSQLGSAPKSNKKATTKS